MTKLFKLINALENIRKIPQFLFLEGVHPYSMFAVRKAVLNFKKENPDIQEIDFIINSPGGSAPDAYRIIRTLRNNFETVNIIVPFWAKSAATLLALGGSSIIMDEFAEFGPLDAQIAKEKDDSPYYERESALNDEHSLDRIETRYKMMYQSMYLDMYENDKISIHKNLLSKQLLNASLKFYEPLLKQINPYRLGEKRRILDLGKDYAEKILAQFNSTISTKKSILLVDYLVNRCSDHGFIIDYNTISIFLGDTVKESKEISAEYANALTDLSGYLIDPNTDDFNYVDFVKQIEEEPTDEGEDGNIEKAVQEILHNGLDKVESENGKINVVDKTKITKKTLNGKEN